MPDITGTIITRTQRTSFLFKSIFLVIGSVLILTGSAVRREFLLAGVSMWVTGVAIDWYIIYMVYREMDEIRTDIEAARDDLQRTKTDIQKTKEEMIDTQMKAEDTAQRIKGVATDMYDTQGSTDMWGELQTTPENRTENISRDEDDPYQY